MFNNREIAIVLWASALAIVVLRTPSMRASIKDVGRAFLAPQIVRISILMIAYVAFGVWGLAEIGIWDSSYLKNTLLWTVFVAFALLFRAKSFAEEPHYLRRIVTDNFKFTAILEFVVNAYALPLLAELVLVPFATFLVLLQAVAEREPEHAPVAKFANIVLFVIGLSLVIYAFRQLAGDLSAFVQPATARDFLMPSVLTLCYLPFLAFMAFYLLYENIDQRVGFAIKDAALRRYAFREALRRFHIRASLVQRWARNIALHAPHDKKGVDQSIAEVFEVEARARNPEAVPFSEGWSPFLAGVFLAMSNLRTGDYHRLVADTEEWWAESPPLAVGGDVLPPTITYRIYGNARAATRLRLVLFGTDMAYEKEARLQFSAMAAALYRAALGDEMPEVLEVQLLGAKAASHTCRGKSIVLEADRWEHKSTQGFEQILTIQNPDHQSALT